MRSQVTRRAGQDVHLCLRIRLEPELPESGLDGLYGMEITILPQEQLTQRGKQAVRIALAV
jgi:hypothetical protein